MGSEELEARRQPKGRAKAVAKGPGQAKQIYCHLCGKPADIKTFRTSHLKVCRRMWREDEDGLVRKLIDAGLLPHGAKVVATFSLSPPLAPHSRPNPPPLPSLPPIFN